MFTIKINIANRKAFESMKDHLEYMCQLNGATITCEDSEEIYTNKINELYERFMMRVDETDFSVYDCDYSSRCSFVLLWRNNKFHSGFAYRSPEDQQDEKIAEILCTSRALGWKDIEQELLDILD